MNKRSNIAPAIHISNLDFRYDTTYLFKDLNIELPANQFTCILGPSGVGKTSLLQLIAGLEKSTGTIRASDGLPLDKRIAYMAQTDLLMPWLNVLDNTLLGLKLRGEKCDASHKQQAIQLLEKIGLKDHIHKKPNELSGGQRQRVALVRTLMEDKPIVLMDEPFSALDAITRLKLQDLAVELLKDKTILLVTHDPLEALRLGHQVYVLSGSPAHLGESLKPQGARPRDASSEEIAKLQTQLWQLLNNAHEVA